MQARLDYTKIAPEVYRSMLGLEKTINSSGLEVILLDLVRLRVSQINGCAYCIEMHAKDLREPEAKANNVSTCSTPGGNRHSTRNASAWL
jgi:AhpD family alkylhydroperoxidase